VKESDDVKIAHAEIKSVIEHLHKIVNKYNLAYIGYIWGEEPPLLMRIGNVSEIGPDLTALLLQLSDMTNQKIGEGLVIRDPLTGEN